MVVCTNLLFSETAWSAPTSSVVSAQTSYDVLHDGTNYIRVGETFVCSSLPPSPFPSSWHLRSDIFVVTSSPSPSPFSFFLLFLILSVSRLVLQRTTNPHPLHLFRFSHVDSVFPESFTFLLWVRILGGGGHWPKWESSNSVVHLEPDASFGTCGFFRRKFLLEDFCRKNLPFSS